MSEGYMNRVPADADNQYRDYSETCKAFLSKLSNEQLDSLRLKYFYHITNERHATSILQNGLNRDSVLNDDAEDFLFLESLYKKYGISGDALAAFTAGKPAGHSINRFQKILKSTF
jgi:hypothetical protein